MKTPGIPCHSIGRSVVRGTRVITLAIVAILLLPKSAHSGKAAAGKSKATYSALAEAPGKARERKNPFEGDSQALAAGGKLFEQHCAECHGRKAGGTRRAPSLVREEVQAATPGTLFWVLTNGVVRRGMPVWSKLPESQRWQIVTFLRSLNSSSARPGPD